ncbi:hypothetical protein ABIF38_006207 [Bradyrhizobium japonicum]|jgi:hypothetical protein|uniref:Uncharacterized protein n=2 Tax=Nitrobacteraceae TaxID=41294 RepID=A0ABV4F1U1_BRAEL|nr:hypothetical protein [Bradyrhizobium elkanii]GEC53183.1 hypothetical protein BEL01nite_22260 [Bradyrhizobium elkanii]
MAEPDAGRSMKNLQMPRTSIIIFCLSVLVLSMSATGVAEARGGFNPNCRVPRISLCPGCTVAVKIIVLQKRECRINYGSLGPMHSEAVANFAVHQTAD